MRKLQHGNGNTPHPGIGLRDDIEALGLSIAEAALGLGVTRQPSHNVVSGRSAITSEMAVRLERAIGGTSSHWMRLQNAFDIAKVRKQDLAVERLAPKI